MKDEFLEYYPNRIAKEHKFEKHLKNPKRFHQFSREQHFEDEKLGVKRAFAFQEFHLWKDWIEKGRNIFDFSNNISDLLKETDILDMDISLIKSPYSTFYIDLSKAKIPFEENGEIYIEGAFIRDDIEENEDWERTISINFVSSDYINNYWKINKDLCWDSDRGFQSILLFLDRKGNLNTIKEAVEYIKKAFLNNGYDDLTENRKNELHQIHNQFIDRTINFIINCLLYLTTKEVDIEEEYPKNLPSYLKAKLSKANSKRKTEIAETEIIRSGFTKIKYVGRKIKSNYISNDLNGEISTHWRKGHWRNQKFGKNLLESKLVWIMPTIVNKEKGEPKKGHIYEIK
jgi:hypothetical protein